MRIKITATYIMENVSEDELRDLNSNNHEEAFMELTIAGESGEENFEIKTEVLP